MSQITNLRIKTTSGVFVGGLCETCDRSHGRTKTKDIYVNVIPYKLYVALLNSYTFSEKSCKGGWGTEICDLTGEIFAPEFLLYLCDECHEKYIKPLYEDENIKCHR